MGVVLICMLRLFVCRERGKSRLKAVHQSIPLVLARTCRLTAFSEMLSVIRFHDWALTVHAASRKTVEWARMLSNIQSWTVVKSP